MFNGGYLIAIDGKAVLRFIQTFCHVRTCYCLCEHIKNTINNSLQTEA